MWSCWVRRRLIDAQLSEEPSWIALFAKDGRSLTPEEAEEASRLLRAARSDLRALEALAADPEQEQDVIGFHAQQAVEKALKAIIAASGAEIPYTHDVSFLLDVLADHPTPVPQGVAQADWLTPWAVGMSYGVNAAVSLDRRAAVDVARTAVRWATEVIDRA